MIGQFLCSQFQWENGRPYTSAWVRIWGRKSRKPSRWYWKRPMRQVPHNREKEPHCLLVQAQPGSSFCWNWIPLCPLPTNPKLGLNPVHPSIPNYSSASSKPQLRASLQLLSWPFIQDLMIWGSVFPTRLWVTWEQVPCFLHLWSPYLAWCLVQGPSIMKAYRPNDRTDEPASKRKPWLDKTVFPALQVQIVWHMSCCTLRQFFKKFSLVGAFQNSSGITSSILSLPPFCPWRLTGKEGIIILLSGTRKPRYLRVRGHDCGCTWAGGGVKTQTEKKNFFSPFITFDLFQSILIPLCLFRFVWYFSARAKWGTPRWMPVPAASDSYRKTPLALTGNSNRSCYFWCPMSDLCLINFPSSCPEDMLTQRTFEPLLGHWSKMGWKTLFGF